jgi:lipopolysaccharide export system ATP-binding protein
MSTANPSQLRHSQSARISLRTTISAPDVMVMRGTRSADRPPGHDKFVGLVTLQREYVVRSYVTEPRVRAVGRLSTGLASLATDAISYAIGRNHILSGISIHVDQNEVVGLLGRDGAGKTCMFQLLAGLVAPNSGKIILDGQDITARMPDARVRLGLSYLAEEPSIFRDLSVEENIQLALTFAQLDTDARTPRLEELIRIFQLQGVRTQSATSLSGGERRRCEVARAMATNPAILLLDEPFRGLDPMSVGEVSRTIASLREQGTGILISDYDLHDLIELIDRAYVLHEGEVIFSGTAAELMADPGVRHLYLGESFSL